MMISDEELHYWGDWFVALELERYLPFEQFLSAPERHLDRIYHRRHRPLLAAQERVRSRLNHAERMDIHACDYPTLLQRVAHGETTVTDAEELEQVIACARGIVDLPRRNGCAIEALHHRRHHGFNSRGRFRDRNESAEVMTR